MNRRAALAGLVTGALGCGCGGGRSREAPPDPRSKEVTEFHAALQDGDVEIIRRLIAAKPFLVNARNEQGVSPLQVAEGQQNQELADLLKQKGAH